MKNTKRLFTLILVLVLTIACVTAISSCRNKEEDDDHTHSLKYYEPKESTCKEAGHTGYNGCSCGYKEGYVELPLAKHDYVSVINEYPSLEKAGKKTSTCSVCGNTSVETIDAYTASLPDISEAISDMLEDGTYTLSAKKGSGLVYVKELSDYTYENGEKSFLAFNVVDGQLNSNGSLLTGYLKIDIGVASKILDGTQEPEDITAPSEFEPMIGTEIYLNGNNISVSIFEDGESETENYDLTAIMYKALAEMCDMSYEELVQSMYLGEKITELMPDYEKLLDELSKIEAPEIRPEYVESLEELLSLVSKDLITTTTQSNGNNVYVIDVTALNELLDAVDGKTLEQILTNMYGDRPISTLKSNLLALPETTVMDLADSVITTAEKLGIDKNKAFELIDILIYESSGQKISVESELKKNYEKTIIDLVAESALGEDATAKDRNEFIAEFKTNFNEIVDMIFGATLDDLYMLYAGSIFSEDEEFSFTKELKNTLDALGEILTIEIVTDANGNLISAEAIMTDTISLIITNGDDGLVASMVWDKCEMRVEADENSFKFYILENGTVTTAAVVEITDTDLGGLITKGISVVLSSTEDGKLVSTEIEAEYSYSDDYKALSANIDGTGFEIEVNNAENDKGFNVRFADGGYTTFLVSADYSATAEGNVTKENCSLFVKYENYTIVDAELNLEDGLLLNGDVLINVYVDEYNKDVGKYETTLKNKLEATIACTDKANKKYTVTANGHVINIIAEEDSISFETTVDGVEYTGFVSVIANEINVRFDFCIYSDDELIFAYVYDVTANENSVTTAYYLEILGEVFLDYSYGAYVTDNGVTFKYDITKIFSIPFDDLENNTSSGTTEYIQGSGEFTFTFTPAE